jgi:hypothetical protein
MFMGDGLTQQGIGSERIVRNLTHFKVGGQTLLYFLIKIYLERVVEPDDQLAWIQTLPSAYMVTGAIQRAEAKWRIIFQ